MNMNIDIIFKIAGVGIIVGVLNIILERSDRKDYGMMVTLIGLIVVLMMVIGEMAELFDTIKDVFGF